MTLATPTDEQAVYHCAHCGKILERDAVLFRPMPHQGCALSEDPLHQIEQILDESNPFISGISIRRADLFALVAEIKTLRALLGKE